MSSSSGFTRPQGRSQFNPGTETSQNSQRSYDEERFSASYFNQNQHLNDLPDSDAKAESEYSEPDSELPYSEHDEELHYPEPGEELHSLEPDEELYYSEPDEDFDYSGPDEEVCYSKSDEELRYSEPDEEHLYSNPELEDEQPAGNSPSAALPTASSILREPYKQVLTAFEAIEAQIKELMQRVETSEEDNWSLKTQVENLKAQITHSDHKMISLRTKLQEERNKHFNNTSALTERPWGEKREVTKERQILMKRFSELENDLEDSRMGVDPNTAYEALQAQNTDFREQIGVLERQLDALKRENAEIERLQETIRQQEGVIEQQKQTILEYVPADAPASDVDAPETEQLRLEHEETLRLQYRELEDEHRRLQERETKWRKLFGKFMQRAPDVQRSDASKHQIKKAFKTLHKIVKEGELQGL